MYQNKIYEKKQLNKYSLVIGAVLLLFHLIQQLISTVIVIVLTLKGYTASDINAMLLDPWFAYSLNSLLLIISCTLPFCLLRFLCKKPISIIGSFNSPRKFCFKSCIVFAFGFSIIANVFTAIFNFILESFFGFKAVLPEIGSNTSDDVFEFVFILICSAVVPALVEEFAFRGMILGALRKFGDWPAILASSFIFAAFHANFVQIPFAFIVGIALGIIVVVSGSIWTSVLAHFLINAYALVANRLANIYPEIFEKIFVFSILFGFLSLLYMIIKGAFNLFESRKVCMSQSTKVLRILLSPTIISFIIIMLFIALQSKG